jgi:hypothetical protein
VRISAKQAAFLAAKIISPSPSSHGSFTKSMLTVYDAFGMRTAFRSFSVCSMVDYHLIAGWRWFRLLNL